MELEFHVRRLDGGSFPPAPSEYDVRLVARVPTAELNDWVPPGVKPVETGDTVWLDAVPGSEKAADITEWYAEPRRIVGIDRLRGIVAYRAWAN